MFFGTVEKPPRLSEFDLEVPLAHLISLVHVTYDMHHDMKLEHLLFYRNLN